MKSAYRNRVTERGEKRVHAIANMIHHTNDARLPPHVASCLRKPANVYWIDVSEISADRMFQRTQREAVGRDISQRIVQSIRVEDTSCERIAGADAIDDTRYVNDVGFQALGGCVNPNRNPMTVGVVRRPQSRGDEPKCGKRRECCLASGPPTGLLVAVKARAEQEIDVAVVAQKDIRGGDQFA